MSEAMERTPEAPEKLVGELKRVLRRAQVVRSEAGGPVLTSEQREAIKQLLARATPAIIAQAEQELSREGYTIADLRSACDIHLELFQEAAGRPRFDLPADHPISQFELDHQVIFQALDRLREAVVRQQTPNGPVTDSKDRTPLTESTEVVSEIERYVAVLLAAENHNVRQENTLFPMLERYGIEQPPQIMWQEHTEMRDMKKRMQKILETSPTRTDLGARIEPLALELFEMFSSHSNKERTILYPAALELFSDEDWRTVKDECDEIGYFTRDLPQNWQRSFK